MGNQRLEGPSETLHHHQTISKGTRKGPSRTHLQGCDVRRLHREVHHDANGQQLHNLYKGRRRPNDGNQHIHDHGRSGRRGDDVGLQLHDLACHRRRSIKLSNDSSRHIHDHDRGGRRGDDVRHHDLTCHRRKSMWLGNDSFTCLLHLHRKAQQSDLSNQKHDEVDFFHGQRPILLSQFGTVEQLEGNRQLKLRRERLTRSRLLNSSRLWIGGNGACWSRGSPCRGSQ
jgi:hypothetical protein